MKIIHFYHFDSEPRFPPFLLYVRWKSGVTFVRRCFRDAKCCFVCHFVAQILFQLSNIHSVVQLIVNFSSVNLQENGFNYVLSTFHCSGTSHLSFRQVEFND